MTTCRELEVDFGLRNGADAEKRNPKAELRKVDASLGDVRHQVGNTLKAVLESYRFQTFGEYSALLSTLNIEAKQVRGEYNGTPYTGIVYSVTDDTGKVVSPPFKSSRFGKRFGNELLEKRMLMNLNALKRGNGHLPYRRTSPVPCGRRIHGNGLWNCSGKGVLMWFSVRMSGDVSTVSPSLTTTAGKCSTAHAWARSFLPMCSTIISNGWKHTRKERGGHSATELWQHHRHESSSTLELAAGILSLETNPRDYEEEAFARRMKKKRRPDAGVAFRQNKYQPIYPQFLCNRKTI